MSTNRLLLFTFVILFRSFAACYAQIDLKSIVNVTPPNISNFEKVRNVEINKATGTLNYGVDLYSLSVEKDLSIPLNLNFNNNGFKTQSIPGWVGHGWSMNPGGFIVQEIRGHDDLSSIGLNQTSIKKRLNDYFSNSYSVLERYNYKKDVFEGKYDGEYDVFQVNLPTDNFGFYVNGGEAKTTRFRPFKITVSATSIQIIDDKGVKFSFNEKYVSSSGGSLNEFGYMVAGGVVTWYLSEIVTPNGKKVNFEYINDYSYKMRNNLLTVYHGPTGYGQVGSPCVSTSGQYNGSVLAYSNQKIVSKIKFDDILINFNTVDRNDLLGTDNKKGKALSNIEVYKGSNLIDGYRFSYFNTNRLTLWGIEKVDTKTKIFQSWYKFKYYETGSNKIQDFLLVSEKNTTVNEDHWGYYNGGTAFEYSIPDLDYSKFLPEFARPAPSISKSSKAAVGSLSMLGQLSEVETPTKGKIVISYEPNVINFGSLGDIPLVFAREVKSNYTDKNILEVVAGCMGDGGSGLNRGEFEITEEDQYDIWWSLSRDPNDNVRGGVIEIYKMNGSTEDNIFSHSENNVPAGSTKILLKKGRYKYRLDAGCDYEEAYSNEASLVISLRKEYDISLEVGGNRVKEIKYVDGLKNQKIDAFTYEKPRIMNVPEYITIDQTFGYTTQGPYIPGKDCEPMYYIHSGNKVPLLPYDLIYGKVTKDNGVGKVVSYYNENLSNYGNYQTRPYPQPFMLSWRDPSLMREEYIRKDNGELVQKKLFTYTNSPKILDADNGVKFDKIYILLNGLEKPEDHLRYYAEALSPVCMDKYAISSETTVTYTKIDSIVSTTDYSYSDGDFYPILTQTDNSMTGRTISVMNYMNEYLDNGKFDNLKSKNIIKNPIESVDMKVTGANEKIVKGTIYSYDQFGNMNKVEVLETLNPIARTAFKFSNRALGILPSNGQKAVYSADSRYKEELVILQFDKYKNPIEAKKAFGPVVSYLWGYDGKYPIAEITNVAYSEVFSILTQPVIDGLNAINVTDVAINTAMTKLRSSLSKAMVTSYTYQPLVGMRSKTDARGVTEFYEYDGMQRLKAVLDHLNYVTSSMDYNYRPN